MQFPPARPLFVLAAAIGAVVLVGCGADEDPVVQQPTSESDDTGDTGQGGDAAEPNEADLEFTRNMIVHHEQAVEMAGLAEGRTESTDVRRLAQQIEAAQEPEIELMTEWLDRWGEEPVSDGGMDGMDGMDEGDAMDMGTMSSSDMEALEEAEGTEFDRLFLEMMIEHHKGAIAMAEEVQEAGSHPDVLELAATVIETQEAEVVEMERLLGQLDE